MTFSPSHGDVDGYVQSLPARQLTLTELHREVGRLSRARHTLPVGAARDAVVARMWAAHQERMSLMSLLALRAGLELV